MRSPQGVQKRFTKNEHIVAGIREFCSFVILNLFHEFGNSINR
jgi:hypothetical protein